MSVADLLRWRRICRLRKPSHGGQYPELDRQRPSPLDGTASSLPESHTTCAIPCVRMRRVEPPRPGRTHRRLPAAARPSRERSRAVESREPKWDRRRERDRPRFTPRARSVSRFAVTCLPPCRARLGHLTRRDHGTREWIGAEIEMKSCSSRRRAATPRMRIGEESPGSVYLDACASL